MEYREFIFFEKLCGKLFWEVLDCYHIGDLLEKWLLKYARELLLKAILRLFL
jgi:hypothetical protein